METINPNSLPQTIGWVGASNKGVIFLFVSVLAPPNTTLPGFESGVSVPAADLRGAPG
ncbi:MAG: hypothetical protein WC880_04635 [Candidatus Paceibacterota bacterium]